MSGQRSTSRSQPKQNADPAVHPGGGLTHPIESSPRKWFPTVDASCFSAVISHLGGHKARHRPLMKRKRSPVKLYTQTDLIRDVLADALEIMEIQAPYLPNILVEYLPIYHWSGDHESKIVSTHSNTITSNERGLFGVVSGPKLDPNTDHIVNLRLIDGVEFGVGVASEENMEKEDERDFMCQKGGWGYYNYKTKHQGRPKYPAGWYAEDRECVNKLPEKDIIQKDDVLTVVVTREGLSDNGIDAMFNRPRPGNGKFTVRYFKNGAQLGGKESEFHGIQGPLRICLNYYFMSSTIQLLSDFKISKKVVTAGLRA